MKQPRRMHKKKTNESIVWQLDNPPQLDCLLAFTGDGALHVIVTPLADILSLSWVITVWYGLGFSLDSCS